MKYTVHWKHIAEEELAEIWLSAPDRQAVVNAAAELEYSLQFRPGRMGEPWEDGYRIAVHFPLAITYEVQSEDRRVMVVHVEHVDPTLS